VAPSGGAPNTPPNGPHPSNPQSSPNLVLFDPKAVVPSQPLYLQRNDQLFFYSYTTVVGAQIRVNYRFLTPEGEIKEGQFTSPPFTGFNLSGFQLYEGWLLSFQIAQITAQAAGAWTFTQASIGRGSVAIFGSPAQGSIWQGFVLNAASNGWPGTVPKEITDGPGVIRSITGSTPAAGAEISEVVPANRRWTLLALRAALTTSATVANRFPGFTLDDGTNVLYGVRTNAAQTATLVDSYYAAPGSQFYNDTQSSIIIPFPTPTQLKAGFRIRTATVGLQAGDQWGAPQYEVLEWGNWDT